MTAFPPKEFQAVMIELDDTKRHDFLSDEARSGFGDDDESFGLGRHGGGEAQSAKREQEIEQSAASFVEIGAVDIAPKGIEISKKDEEKTQQVRDVENSVAEKDDEELFAEMSNEAVPEIFATSELEAIHSAEDNNSADEIDADDLQEEKYQEPSAASTIPTAHEAYIPPAYAHLDTIITENASTDGSRKVITIPGAEEQRKEDAAKAAAQAAQSNINTPRRNARSRNAIAASLAGILLAALVASGYMLMRKTTIGSGAQSLWATLTGGRTESGVQDSTALTLLDLTKKSQEKNTLNNENQNLPNNTSNTSSKTSVPAVTTSVESQTANAQSTQPPTAQSSNDAIKAEISSAPVSSQNKPTTLAAKTPSATLQPQEKASPAAPTTKQIPDTKQTPPVSTTKQPNNQATKPIPNKQENSLLTTTTAKTKQNQPSPASALERKQTQQISGVFAIQVYATPSIADAEDWVERLKRRGMVNAMVTSQVVRGQTMYRVRFGLYNTLHEAERDAERFGYMGSWVVRLR